MDTSEFYGKEKISRILLKIAPPVMLAQLIQALYNIVDSLFVGKYSETGLTALSIIYPLQLLMIALAVGTGVGINTDMAYYFGIRQEKKSRRSGRHRHAAGSFSMDCFCGSLLSDHAVLCEDFDKFRRNHTRCCRIWKNRLRGQYRTVYRRSLEQNPAGTRRYENADGGTDRRSDHEYHS